MKYAGRFYFWNIFIKYMKDCFKKIMCVQKYIDRQWCQFKHLLSYLSIVKIKFGRLNIVRFVTSNSKYDALRRGFLSVWVFSIDLKYFFRILCFWSFQCVDSIKFRNIYLILTFFYEKSCDHCNELVVCICSIVNC